MGSPSVPLLTESVSVVIPTHDRLDLLERAVRSVIAQSQSPVELFVVDDVGSAAVQSLVATCDEAATFPVIYLDASELEIKAAGASRNVGAEASAGQVIAFLDDDDYWDPSYLKCAVEALAAGSYGLVITGAFNEIDDLRQPGMTPTVKSLEGIHPGMTGSNMMVKRDAFFSVSGFDPNMWVMNDVDIFIRLRSAGVSIGIVSERLVIQEGRGAGHLSSRSERRAKGLERFLSKHTLQLGFRDKRSVQRRIHRARTGPDHSWNERFYHTVALCFYTRPAGYFQTIKRRVLLRKPMY